MRELNPLGSAGSWELSVVLGLATWSYSLLSTVAAQKAVTDLGLSVLAVVSISVAIALNMAQSAPQTATYGRRNYALVVGLGIVAALLQGASSRGGVASIATDWGPLALAGLLAATSSFRPQIDQAVAGLGATVLVGAQATVEGFETPTQFGIVYYVVTAIAPLVIVTLGQGAYTGFAIRSLSAWHRGFAQTQTDVTTLVGMGAARKIGQDFLTEFSVDVQPLLSKILRSGRVTADDSEGAAVAAERIRSRLVTLSRQTWIDRLNVSVLDPQRVAQNLDMPARAAISALVRGLALHGVRNVAVKFESASAMSPLSVAIVGDHSQGRFFLRTQLAPILRVLFVVFDNVHVNYATTSMTLQFDYGGEKRGVS